MKNHIYTGMVVILLILGCCIMGCSGREPNIVIKSTYQASVSDLQRDPIPITTHLDLVNTGEGDAKNVQIDVEILYNNRAVKTEVVYFGTVKAGESKVKDVIIFIPKIANFDNKLFDMHLKTFVDGKTVSTNNL